MFFFVLVGVDFVSCEYVESIYYLQSYTRIWVSDLCEGTSIQYIFIFVLDPKKGQHSKFKAIHVIFDLSGEYPCYFLMSLSVIISNNSKPEVLANIGRIPPVSLGILHSN